MRTFQILTLSLALAAVLGARQATEVTPADLAAIRKVPDRVADAVNKGDAKALAAVFTEEGDHVTLTRSGVERGVKGRSVMVKHFLERFSRRPSNFSRTMTATITSVQRVNTEAVILNGSWNFTAGVGQEGQKEPPTAEQYIVVLAKQAGQWLIVASRHGPAEPRAVE